MTPFLLVLSSPSGGGKSTIRQRLIETRDDVGYSVSATTRKRRVGERAGRDYHFLTRAEFDRRKAAGAFLESATYNGERYGTLVSEVKRNFANGKHVVLEIEVDGARQVRRRFPDAVQVFVLPPSGRVLVRRLRERRTESVAALLARLQHARDEFAAVAEYDYVVLNDDLDHAVAAVSAIVDAEARRSARQRDLAKRLATLRREVAAEAKRIRKLK